MSSHAPKQVVLRWLDAFNGADVDGLMALYADFATNHQVAESPATGKQAIRRMFEAAFAQAEPVCIPDNIFEDGEWAILEWYDLQGLRGCGFFHVVQGRIVFQRGYWDKLTFQRLHGLNQPAKG